MRVLHTLNELRPSGAEKMLEVSAAHWANRGVELAVLSAGDEPGAFACALESAGIAVHHIPMRHALPFARGLLALIRKERYDVVHVHAERGNILVGLVAHFGCKTVVRTVHSVFAFRGALRAERVVQRAFLRMVGVQHVSVGESVSRSELHNFFNPTTTVRNWFDQKRFVTPDVQSRNEARRQLGIDADQFVLLTVGNCSQIKNHSRVIEALNMVDDEGHLVYIHAGAEHSDLAERTCAKRLGVAERCRFLGSVDDVRELMWASDCYVMPSRWEGLGIAALEALATGLPSVLADVPGLRDMKAFVHDGVEWIAPTVDGVASGVGRMLKMTEGDRRVAGSRASSMVHEHFAIGRGVEEYLRLYEAPLRDSGRAIDVAT